MITKPDTVNAILEALLDRDATYRGIARSVGMTLDELFELLETPEMQAKIQRMQRLLDQRAALLTAANEAAAIGALGAAIETAREDEAKRANLVIERRRAIQNDVGHEIITMLDDSLAQLDGRHRRRVETMRTARAILTQARASRSRSGSRSQHPTDRSIPIGETDHAPGAQENRPDRTPVHAAA